MAASLYGIERLSANAGEQFLAAVTESRLLAFETVDLYYGVAVQYERRGRKGTALALLEKIQQSHPSYRDVAERIAALKKRISEEGGATLPPDAEPIRQRKDTLQPAGRQSAIDAM